MASFSPPPFYHPASHLPGMSYIHAYPGRTFTISRRDSVDPINTTNGQIVIHRGPEKQLAVDKPSVSSNALPTGSECRMFTRLFDLPAELRDMIYEFALEPNKTRCTVASGMSIQHCFCLICDTRDRGDTQPALSRVSRIVRKETLPLFYRLHNFVAHPNRYYNFAKPDQESKDLGASAFFRKWIYAIGPHNVRLVKNIVAVEQRPHSKTEDESAAAVVLALQRFCNEYRIPQRTHIVSKKDWAMFKVARFRVMATEMGATGLHSKKLWDIVHVNESIYHGEAPYQYEDDYEAGY